MKRRLIEKYLMLVLGIIMCAYSVTGVLRPNKLMTGGITGLSRIFETIIGDKFDIIIFGQSQLFNFIYYLLAILVLISAYIFIGKDDAIKIIFMTFVYPAALFLFSYINIPSFTIFIPVMSGSNEIGFVQDLLIPAMAYGVIGGIGTGFLLRSGYTSGGSDTIAKMLHIRVLPFISLGQIMLVVDGAIIISSIFVFGLKIPAYAFLTKFIYVKSIDMIVLGVGNRRVKMEIISDKYQEITNYIINTIHRGVTFIDTEGGYLHKKTKQIVTICSPRESLLIKNYIASLDEFAFVYVIPSSTVWGRGFRNIRTDELSEY